MGSHLFLQPFFQKMEKTPQKTIIRRARNRQKVLQVEKRNCYEKTSYRGITNFSSKNKYGFNSSFTCILCAQPNKFFLLIRHMVTEVTRVKKLALIYSTVSDDLPASFITTLVG